MYVQELLAACAILVTFLAADVTSTTGTNTVTVHKTKCAPVPQNTIVWKGVIDFTIPIKILYVVGGELTFVKDDGRYAEVTGIAQTANHLVCVTVHGNATAGHVFEMYLHLAPMVTSGPPTDAGTGSLRVRRATDLWSVNHASSTSSVDDLLKPFEPMHRQWGDDSLSSSSRHGSQPSFRVHYNKGSYTKTSHRGAGFYSTPSELPDGVDDLILTYDVFFEHFGFGKGGKLPGLFGGEKGDGAYACSGGHNPDSCFSLRLMWRAHGDGELYAYIPQKQDSGFHDRDDLIGHSAYGQSLGRGKISFKNNKWQTVFEQVHLNTPGQFDGWVRICNTVEGHRMCYTADKLNLRNHSGHHIRGLVFSTFFGGSSSDYAAPNDCATYFRNFRLQVPDSVIIG